MQHNAPSGHTGEQEPSGPGHHTCSVMQGASTRVNSNEVVQDTANTCAPRAAEGRETTNHTPWVVGTGATQLTQRASSRGRILRPLVRARSGCLGDHGKHHPEPWKQPVTGEPLHGPGAGHLPGIAVPQLKPQG